MKASTLVEFAPRLFTEGPSRAWSSPIHSSSTGEGVPWCLMSTTPVTSSSIACSTAVSAPGNSTRGSRKLTHAICEARHVPGRTLPVRGVTAPAGLPPFDSAVGEVLERTVLAAQARIEVLLLMAKREQVVVTPPDGIGWRGKSLAKRCLALSLESSEIGDATGEFGHAVVQWSALLFVARGDSTSPAATPEAAELLIV